MWISRASQHLSEANAFKGKSNLSTVIQYAYHRLCKAHIVRSQPNSKDPCTCPFQTCRALHSNAKQGKTAILSSIGSYKVYIINQGLNTLSYCQNGGLFLELEAKGLTVLLSGSRTP